MSAHAVRVRAPALVLAAVLTAPPAAGQDLARRAREADARSVRLVFPARPDVCGTGDGILIREPDGSTLLMGRRTTSRHGRLRGGPPCETGNVVVVLERDGDRWSTASVAIAARRDGGPLREPGVRDLGVVPGQAAVDFLLEEARREEGPVARDLILAAALARDAVVWPGLLELARDRSVPERTRRSALRWLGREAAQKAVRGLGGIVADRTESDEIREAAVFGLSRMPPERAVPLLLHVARTVDHARVRSRALFWLAGFDDPRVTALFEEILGGSR